MDNNSTALLYSQIQHPPGTNRRKISKHIPGDITGEDSLTNYSDYTNGRRLSHWNNRTFVTSYPLGKAHCLSPGLLFSCPTELVPWHFCLQVFLQLLPGQKGQQNPCETRLLQGRLWRRSQPSGVSPAVRCWIQQLPWSSMEVPAGYSTILPNELSTFPILPHTSLYIPYTELSSWLLLGGRAASKCFFSSRQLSFSYFCLSPALQKTFSI